MSKKNLIWIYTLTLLLLSSMVISNFYLSTSKLFAKSSIYLSVLEDTITEGEVFHVEIKNEQELSELSIDPVDLNNDQVKPNRKFVLDIPEGIEFEQQLQTEKEVTFNWDETDRKLLISIPDSQTMIKVALRAEVQGIYTTNIYPQESFKTKKSLDFSVLKSNENNVTNTIETEVLDENLENSFPEENIQGFVPEVPVVNTDIDMREYHSVYSWNQLVQAVSNSSITKIVLMNNIFAVGTSNFSSRTENLEINGNGFTLSLNSNSMMLGNLSSGVEKTFHFNNITILYSNTGSDFIRANDSVAGGRWRILLENTTISGSRRAVDARRSEVTLKGATYIRTRRSNFALGSLVVEEGSQYTSIVFNSNRAAVWFPRNVSGAAVTGKNSEFRVKSDARVNFYRENNVNASQPAVFRHFRSYIIEEGARVNYFYQNQNGGVAPLGDQSAANGRPQSYTILSGGELNIYTSNQMGIHFRRRDTSLVTETGGKMNVRLINQNNNIIPNIPVSPDEGGEDEDEDEDDGDEDEPDVSLNRLINLAGTRTSITIRDPRNLDIRSNEATDLFSISATSTFTINNSHVSVWNNSEFFWEEPSIARPDVLNFSQRGQTVTSSDFLLMFSVNVTSENFKRISAKGTTIYEDEQAEIKVSYNDENGNTIFPSEIITGTLDVPTVIESATPGGLLENANYTIKDILTVNGKYDEETYEFTPESSNSSLTFILESEEIQKPEKGVIKVRYEGDDGTLLANDTITGKVGTEYITEAREFDGWVLIKKPSNATGTFTEEEITITYLYKQVSKDAVLTVEFINELEQLIPGYTLTLETQIGDSLDLTTEEVVLTQIQTLIEAGYTITERPENEESVVITESEMTVRYTAQGQLSLVSVPKTIDFGSLTYDATTQRVEESTLDAPLAVLDMRANTVGGWTMTATLSSPMVNDRGEELVNALRYVYQGEETILDANAQEIYTTQGTDERRVSVSDSWGTEKGSDGLKLQINSADMVYTGKYSGVISWTLMAGQP